MSVILPNNAYNGSATLVLAGMIVFCLIRSFITWMRKPLLLLPGPPQVPDAVRVAGDRPLFHHRSQHMLDLVATLDPGGEPRARPSGDGLLSARSGTGAAEAD